MRTVAVAIGFALAFASCSQKNAPVDAVATASSSAITPTPVSTVAPTSFTATSVPLSSALRQRMTGVSWRPDCPVGLDDLRLLTVSYRTSDGGVRRGELVINADAADALTRAFRALFDAGYPITKMRIIDEYGGDDDRSMNDDNTSAFNCRRSTGGTTWSQHAYGRAVDINPFENPWVKGDKVDPPAAARYADRSRTDRKMVRHGDVVWRAFADVGWRWGGDWRSPKDYQHFSANGL